eukprot:g50927.t1
MSISHVAENSCTKSTLFVLQEIVPIRFRAEAHSWKGNCHQSCFFCTEFFTKGLSCASALMEAREVAPDVYKVDFSKPRYDQSTYMGRVRHFLDVINPMSLFTSDATLKKSVELLEAQENHTLDPTVTVEDLWRAKAVKESVLHPQTGQPIFPLCRMSAFVPMNAPIVVGMLSTQSKAGMIFWQWYNQSYNVAVNHANRNASNEMSTEAIASAYAGAVLSSCSIALGLDSVLKKAEAAKLSPLLLRVSRSLIPFTAVAGAGSLNIYLMRRNETKEGIMVQDADGNDVGTSVIAGKMAVQQSAITRVVLPMPILVLPPLIENGLKSGGLWPTTPRMASATKLGLIISCLSFALPFSIGLFPHVCQKASPLNFYFSTRGFKDALKYELRGSEVRCLKN